MQKETNFMVNESLQQYRQKAKRLVKPSSNRCKYKQVYEWSKFQLTRFSRLIQKCEQSEMEAKLLEEQKKIVLSMLLQIGRITRQECAEKGFLVEQMLKYAMSFLNQHQKYYDMLSYRQIKHFNQSIVDMEKQYKHQTFELRQQLDILRKDKQHRWRNIFMVVKDNRVLRRQKAKLMQKHREEVWRIRQLEEDLINLRSQNQKYKILFQSYSSKQNILKNYVTNQLLLSKLDQKVRQYPGRARRLLKKQLIDLQINELNSLQHKIKFIVQSMEQNNEVCLDCDDWFDNIETTRLFYNVSVQTYIETESIAINTITPKTPAKTVHSIKVQARSRDFVYLQEISKVIDLKVHQPSKKAATVQRKRTGHQSFMNASASKYKKRVSISTGNNDQNLISEVLLNTKRSQLKNQQRMRIQQAINVKIPGIKPKKINRNLPSINISDHPSLMPSDTQNQLPQYLKEDKKVQLFPKTKYSSKLIKKKQNFIRKQESPIQNIYQKIIQKAKCSYIFNSQIYQLCYKPVIITTENKQTNQQNFPNCQYVCNSEVKCQRTQFELILQQKQSPVQQKNVNSLLNNKTFLKFVKQKLRKQKCQTESVKKQLYKHQPIIQVFESSSNRSLQSLQNGQIDQINENQISIQNTERIHILQQDKITSKKNLTLNKINKSKHTIQDAKMWKNNFIKHRRQHTQNIQVNKNMKYQQITMSTKQHRKQEEISKQLQKNPCKIMPFKNSLEKQNKQVFGKKIGVKTESNQSDGLNKLVDQRYMISGEKLLQKLMSSIFCRRKQIINTPQNLRSYINNFLSSLFGCKSSNLATKIRPVQKFFATIKDYHKKKTIDLFLSLLLQKLMPIKGFQLFTQDVFVLFAMMIDKLNSLGVLPGIFNVLAVPKDYGIKVIQYLCSIYLSPQQTIEFIKSKVDITSEQQNINMMKYFLVFVNELETIIYGSQLWQLFSSISSSAAQYLSQNQILQIMMPSYFLNISHQCHRQRISFYAAKQLPIHRLCMYAHRYNWNEIYNIKSWIHEKYLQYFGVFCFTQFQMDDFCHSLELGLNKSGQFKFLLKIFKQMKFRYDILKTPFDQNYLKLCKLAIIFNDIEKKKIFSQNLSTIQQVYRRHLKNVSLNQNKKQ